MVLDFLIPVSDKILAYNALLPSQAMGNAIKIHSEKGGLPQMKGVKLAIFGVNESRNAFEKKRILLDINAIRKQFYKLMFGNWGATVVDLGDVPQGAAVTDTYFVVKQLVASLLEDKIVPIVIGATQDITYPIYRAFDHLNQMVNLVTIDSRFDFGNQDAIISSHSYMSRIITEKPNILLNFSNLGYQSYFNAQEELDLMDKLFFDRYRLGEVSAELQIAEPVLRYAHLVSLDVRAIKASEMGGSESFSPNGFDGREICSLSRYAGLSDSVQVFGVFESENHSNASQLVAQIIWYFIEGFNLRQKEHPLAAPENFLKYTVTLENHDLEFYRSLMTQRWWVGVSFLDPVDNKKGIPALLACTENDYIAACDNKIPERWFKAQKKSFI